ncbi:MAG: caspase family protein [Gammaproteobacteria bacterium]|nr:caspase family protein [Gammaproteobacteria bacterium]
MLRNLTEQTTRIRLLSILVWVVTQAGCGDNHPSTAGSVQPGSLCSYAAARPTNGIRRLALVVGVGKYKNEKVPSLVGPPNDAKHIYELLTGDKGYGFPKENVCLLLDEQATLGRFREAFDKVLVDRAQAGDIAVLFFAGHGSQTRDKNGDEPDNMDETFLLSDSRTAGQGDLIDDEFNEMLGKLYKKTPHITVIADSCNSGTSMRGDNGTFSARFAQPMDESLNTSTASSPGDGGHEWIPESMPGLIALTAASDGTSALETAGHGVFTDALLKVLSMTQNQPLTYAQLARQVPPLVAANSYQIPYFQGDLNQVVFGNTGRDHPSGWEITAIDSQIKLTGTPLSGMGKGAELRVYAGTATGGTTRDPGQAKATLSVDFSSGVNASAHISAAKEGAAPLEVGDIALLVRPADDFIKLKVRIRPASEPGGVHTDRAAAIRSVINQDDDAKLLIEAGDTQGDFELIQNFDGRLQLLGPENTVRNTFSDDKTIAKSLWQHARQRGLLALQGEGGTLYTDNDTLQVQLVPLRNQGACAKGVWEQAAPNSEQIIPLCYSWNIRVALSAKSPTPLLVGGIIASTDGGIYGFPVDGRTVLLKPGEQVTFNGQGETFRGTPPLDVLDRVQVFGTQETNPVAWHALTSPSAARALGQKKSPLYQALDTYLTPGSRGVSVETQAVESSPWTLSTLGMRVEANTRFLSTKTDTAPIAKREYTINNFNSAAYRPDDPNTALYKVLAKADTLVNASAQDGIKYKQHAWSQPSDEKNLQLGIDCSRFIWYVFTRAGLRYNRNNEYLSTVAMVSKTSAMSDEFQRCDNDPVFKLGDVLVYRDDKQGDGHTVMVIDAVKRIAVGSMGWDGNAKDVPGDVADTGVEYQKIKYKPDMKRWDRTGMELKACWRYNQFIEQAKSPGGQPGTKALTSICDATNRCGIKN